LVSDVMPKPINETNNRPPKICNIFFRVGFLRNRENAVGFITPTTKPIKEPNNRSPNRLAM